MNLDEISRTRALVVGGLSVLLVSLPFLVVQFPPAVDLPQHVAQVRLLLSAWHDPAGPYVIQWMAPNVLVYGLLAAVWSVLPPLAVGRVALWGLAVLWVTSIAWLARRRGRAPEAAALASVLVFNHALYWGFLNYLIGFPVFVLWLVLTLSPRRAPSWGTTMARVGAAALLVQAHVLWFLAAAGWTALWTILERPPRARVIERSLALGPVGAAALAWSMWLRASRTQDGFDVAAHWHVMPWSRLRPSWLLWSALGGLRGNIELAVCVTLACWVALAFATRRGVAAQGPVDPGDAGAPARLGESGRVDRPLALAAGWLFFVGILAPDKYLNTIHLASRWIPCALMVGILASPLPRLRTRVLWLLSVGVLSLSTLTTAAAWLAFERDELDGLTRALERLPPRQRVLGLSFIQASAVIEGRPFLQVFAYAQVLRGGSLNFSFTQHASSVVRDRDHRRAPWTPGLDWTPLNVAARDFSYFDHVLVNETPAGHALRSVDPAYARDRGGALASLRRTVDPTIDGAVSVGRWTSSPDRATG